MNKLDQVEVLSQQLGCSHETAFDLVYCPDFICDENETDDAL